MQDHCLNSIKKNVFNTVSVVSKVFTLSSVHVILLGWLIYDIPLLGYPMSNINLLDETKLYRGSNI